MHNDPPGHGKAHQDSIDSYELSVLSHIAIVSPSSILNYIPPPPSTDTCQVGLEVLEQSSFQRVEPEGIERILKMPEGQ